MYIMMKATIKTTARVRASAELRQAGHGAIVTRMRTWLLSGGSSRAEGVSPDTECIDADVSD